MRATYISFNIENGAEAYGAHTLAKIIKKSGADVAFLQEVTCYDILRSIAKELGWFAILFPRTATAILASEFIEAVADQIVKTYSGMYYYVVHLTDYPYIPFEASGIEYCQDACFFSKDSALLEKRAFKTRWPEIQEIIANLQKAKIPVNATVIIGGDFNEPSYRDWNSDAVRRRRVPIVVNFPIARLLEQLGFVDTFREANPHKMGYTWPDRSVGYEHRRDRIDFIFARNAVVHESDVIRTGLSDHSVVRTTCSIRREASEVSDADRE